MRNAGSHSRLLSERLGLSVCPAVSLGCAFVRVLLRLIPVRTREPRELRSKLPCVESGVDVHLYFPDCASECNALIWVLTWGRSGLEGEAREQQHAFVGLQAPGASRIPADAVVSGSSSALALVEAEVTIDFSRLSRSDKKTLSFHLKEVIVVFPLQIGR